MVEFGFLRETKEMADSAGIDKDTGIVRTGLEEYLRVMFPDITDWVHDKQIPSLPDGIKSRRRPDYRSETLKIIVEFDGLPHYTSPEKILDDETAKKFYESLGYKVVRIPYFIQLTKSAVKTLFGVDVQRDLFPDGVPSLGIKGRNTPAFLCLAGVERMAKEFLRFEDQLAVNIKYLDSLNTVLG